MNKSYLNFRTDMADERIDIYKRVHNLSEIDGVIVKSTDIDNVKVTTVDITNENGEKALSKKMGTYITIESLNIEYLSEDEKQILISKVAEQIKLLVKDDHKSIMVVGLGNMYVTPDALGPKVVKYLDITRHLLKFAKEYVDINTREVSAISPGVLGTTGIETSEIIESVTKKVKPDIVIVIDSLASQSVHRVGKSIQLSNMGIVPGAGVKNKRVGINQDTLKIPVIAIGVPTVVDMATITNEAIDKLLENSKKEIDKFNNENINDKHSNSIFSLLNEDNRYSMIANTLDAENYIVTPKEIDEIIDKMSEVLASSINSISRI
ncbi:MAG: GPR endopeptidase [Clostridia bacterium]|nr:GPR endopeptidase [Clostridia bacterium]MDD4386137.1 GPR endopeptidase [Clostridia bacterium]